jgi:hypothetical protein
MVEELCNIAVWSEDPRGADAVASLPLDLPNRPLDRKKEPIFLGRALALLLRKGTAAALESVEFENSR